MSWSPFHRVVGFARRSLHAQRDVAPADVVDVSSRRDPAMAGLNAPPVHGRHCICERCERQAANTAA
jgi:hypothetical protein